MKRHFPWLLALSPLLISLSPPARAADSAIVVAVCGTPPITYVAGQSYPLTMDTTGTICTAGGGGGGGGNANITEWNTVAVASPFGNNADDLTALTSGFPGFDAWNYVWNPTEGAWDRAQAVPQSAAGTTQTVALGIQGVTGGVALPVSGTFYQATQPISGSVTADSSGAITNPTSTLTLTSATTAYTAGQLIASSATAGSIVVPSFAIANAAGGAIITRMRLSTNDTTSTAWPTVTVQIDLWSAAPTWTNGDRGTWSPATGTGSHLGAYTCIMSAEFGDGAYAECAPAVGNASVIKLASGTSVYWSLEAVTASGVTGASKVFTATAELLN